MRSSTSSSEARRFFRDLAAFLALTTVLVTGLEAWARASFPNFYYEKYATAYAPAPARPIVLGASNAMGGIDPRDLESPSFPVYNFAHSGANPEFFQSWYGLYRRSNPAPTVAIYSADWFMFQKDFLKRTPAADVAYMGLADYLGCFVQPHADYPSLVTNRFSFIKHRDGLKNLTFRQREPQIENTYYKGHAQQVHPRAYHLTPKPSEQVDPTQIEAFRALLARLKADGVRVVCVQMPSYTPEIGEHPAEQARLSALTREAGVGYLNYNGDRRSAFNLDPGNFVDWIHLNRRGAEAFSRRLRRDLDALGVTGGAARL